MKPPKPAYIQVSVEVQPSSKGPPYTQYRVRWGKTRWLVERWDVHQLYTHVNDRAMRRLCIGMAKAEIKRIARL